MNLQCYFEDETIQKPSERRCKNESTAELEYWCSKDHKELWQRKNYGNVKSRGEKLTIAQIQERLRQMGKEVKNA